MDETPQKPNNDVVKKFAMFNLATELGLIIALPLLAFALIGKWADRKFDTFPVITLVGVALAIVSTTLWMIKRLKPYIK